MELLAAFGHAALLALLSGHQNMDYPGGAHAWKEKDVPPPSFVCENPENGHAHAHWLLKWPVSAFDGKDSATASMIERGLTRRLNGDLAFNISGLCKNPLNAAWIIQRPHEGAHTLKELAKGFSVKEMKPWTKRERRTGYGRNCQLFDELGSFARGTVLEYKRNGADHCDFQAQLSELAFRMNDAANFYRPLGAREVSTIAKSVASWTWRYFSEEGLRRWHSRGGKAGMAKRWAGHTSLDEAKPWEAEGISRRMWFYRKAKQEKAQPIAL